MRLGGRLSEDRECSLDVTKAASGQARSRRKVKVALSSVVCYGGWKLCEAVVARSLRPRSLAILESWRAVLVTFVCGVCGLLVALMPHLATTSRAVGICAAQSSEEVTVVCRRLGHTFAPHNNANHLCLGPLSDRLSSTRALRSCSERPAGSGGVHQLLTAFCKTPGLVPR